MKRFLSGSVAVCVLGFVVAGCGGGGIPEGMPEGPQEYKPLPIPGQMQPGKSAKGPEKTATPAPAPAPAK